MSCHLSILKIRHTKIYMLYKFWMSRQKTYTCIYKNKIFLHIYLIFSIYVIQQFLLRILKSICVYLHICIYFLSRVSISDQILLTASCAVEEIVPPFQGYLHEIGFFSIGCNLNSSLQSFSARRLQLRYEHIHMYSWYKRYFGTCASFITCICNDLL